MSYKISYKISVLQIKEMKDTKYAYYTHNGIYTESIYTSTQVNTQVFTLISSRCST